MSMKGKIILANLIVFGILLSALAFFIYSRTAHSELAALDLRLESCAAKIITEFEDEWEEEKNPEWDDILHISVEGLSNMRMSFRTVDGLIVFANDTIGPPPAETLRLVLAGESVKETIAYGRREVRKAVFPVAINNEVRFVLTLITPLMDTNARLGRLALILFMSVR